MESEEFSWQIWRLAFKYDISWQVSTLKYGTTNNKNQLIYKHLGFGLFWQTKGESTFHF